MLLNQLDVTVEHVEIKGGFPPRRDRTSIAQAVGLFGFEPKVCLFGLHPRHGLGDDVLALKMYQQSRPEGSVKDVKVSIRRLVGDSQSLHEELHGSPHDPRPEATISSGTYGDGCPYEVFMWEGPVRFDGDAPLLCPAEEVRLSEVGLGIAREFSRSQ